MTDYDDNYLEWVKQSKLPPLTRTQYLFATWCIQNCEHVNKIGDLETIFSSVRKWLRHGVDLWKEHILIEHEPTTIKLQPATWDWDEIVIEGNNFDWSLSMSDITKKYGKVQKKKHTINESKSLLEWEKDLYQNSESLTEFVDRVAAQQAQENDFIIYGKHKVHCWLVGEVVKKTKNKNIPIGAKVYYHEAGGWYVVKDVHGNYISSYLNFIMNSIRFNGRKPNGEEFRAKSVGELLQDDEPNFHSDTNN